MRTLVIAGICFLAPIVAVVAMYPQDVQRSLGEAKAWAEKTFPVKQPPKNPPAQVG